MGRGGHIKQLYLEVQRAVQALDITISDERGGVTRLTASSLRYSYDAISGWAIFFLLPVRPTDLYLKIRDINDQLCQQPVFVPGLFGIGRRSNAVGNDYAICSLRLSDTLWERVYGKRVSV
jgi:hypothetical protein